MTQKQTLFLIKGRNHEYNNMLLVLIFLLVSISCNEQSKSKDISEGEIEFQIEYLDDKRENPLIALLPKTMTTSFNKNSSHTLIEGFIGTFELAYIINFEKKKNYSLLQILDKKYVYETDITNMAFGYSNMDKLEIEFTDEKKKIAGYNCNRALASFSNDMSDTIEIYYTNEINLSLPNINNPFKQIDGVLMEFSANLAGINMKFKAKKVRHTKVNNDLFDLPDGFTSITQTEMENIINDFNKSADK